ncbi:MAG TPA: hypothetical protein VFJ16_16045 [Longimicrobium sp.]|nr:hypothetical protein [Longimicrobium sp.]
MHPLRTWTTIAFAMLLVCDACSRVPDGTFRGELEGGMPREWGGKSEFCRNARGMQILFDPGRNGFGLMLMNRVPLNTRNVRLKDAGYAVSDEPGVLYVWRPASHPASANLWVTDGSMHLTRNDSTRLAGSIELTLERVQKPEGDTAKPIIARARFSAQPSYHCPIPVL